MWQSSMWWHVPLTAKSVSSLGDKSDQLSVVQAIDLIVLVGKARPYPSGAYFVPWVNNVHSPPVHFVKALLVWVLMYCEIGR